MGFSTPSTGKACGVSPLTSLRSPGALFAGRPPMWGHSSRCFAFGGVSPSIICGQPGSDCIPIVFSKAEKTILGIVFRSFPKNDRDPSMRTVHSSPELNQWPTIPGYADLTGYWIGGLQYTRREGRLWILKRQGGIDVACAGVWEGHGDAGPT